MADAGFAVGLSTHADAAAAAREACDAVRAGLGPATPTLTLVFASPQVCREAETVLAIIHERLAPAALLGCMGETIIAAGREVEQGPALAVWSAHLPDAEIVPFGLAAQEVEGGGIQIVGWPALPDDPPAGPPQGPLLLLADPFSFPADALLAQMNVEGLPVQVIGGLASGGRQRGQHRLFLGTQVLTEGAVGARLTGVEVLPVVSQGCQPIGPDMVITAGEGSKVEQLAGQPAVTKLDEMIGALDARERSLVTQGLLAGLVIDENQPEYERGDYLIRGIHGGDRESGAIYVGERVRVGQTMRFHVRDAASADEDLRAALRRARQALGGERPAGGLIFSCNGRGVGMFGAPDHDAKAVGEELGDPPLAGIFCNGEIGPVGGKNFLHGFTATMAVFASPDHD